MTIYRLALFAAYLAVWISGCAVATPPRSAEKWEGTKLQSIALTRVVFADAGPDPFCERYLPDEIRWQVRRALERKGYRVIPATMPARENSFRPDPWATASAREILDLLPEEAEAIVRVRIDRHLALGSCAKEPFDILEMDGSVELFLPGKATPMWQNRASVRETSLGRGDDLFFRVGAELAGKLLHAFPPAVAP